jgi:hypothetical protein
MQGRQRQRQKRSLIHGVRRLPKRGRGRGTLTATIVLDIPHHPEIDASVLIEANEKVIIIA